jgi:hypothetical protein
MRIILSRKGWDSTTDEQHASPIMPCGKLLSLPIPVTQIQNRQFEQGIPYSDLWFDGTPLSTMISQLAPNFDLDQHAHLDPDLEPDRIDRKPGWRGAFGQIGKAQGVLKDGGVKDGDLFLFFGRFRQAELNGGQLSYPNPERSLHIIFGWLQVGRILDVVPDSFPQVLREYPWLQQHPHILNASVYRNRHNTIYIASDILEIKNPNVNLGVWGSGTFSCFNPSLQLTNPGQHLMSVWRLPPLTPPANYANQWIDNGDHGIFKSNVGRVQEFVFEVSDSQKEKAIAWLKSLFQPR